MKKTTLKIFLCLKQEHEKQIYLVIIFFFENIPFIIGNRPQRKNVKNEKCFTTSCIFSHGVFEL